MLNYQRITLNHPFWIGMEAILNQAFFEGFFIEPPKYIIRILKAVLWCMTILNRKKRGPLFFWSPLTQRAWAFFGQWQIRTCWVTTIVLAETLLCSAATFWCASDKRDEIWWNSRTAMPQLKPRMLFPLHGLVPRVSVARKMVDWNTQ